MNWKYESILLPPVVGKIEKCQEKQNRTNPHLVLVFRGKL